MHETNIQVTQALQAGASGYVVKSAGADDFVDAVRATADGKSYLSPSIAHCVVEALSQPRDGSVSSVAQLSGREREVLQLIAEGLSSKEIAGVLGVSLKTIETHRSNLMGKLNIRKASKLVRIAIHEGLVAL
jgi:DNA-binding NarL/FixJ family response regulator